MKRTTLTLSFLLLTACATPSPADRPHSVADYLGDAELATSTIEACRWRSEAERELMQAKEACRNVREAERQRRQAAYEREVAALSARLEAAFKRPRPR